MRALLFLAIVAAALYGGWRYFNTPAAQIARTLRAAARAAEKSEQESAITDALAAQQTANYFAPSVMLAVSGLHEGEVDRESLRTAIAYARGHAGTLKITLSDITAATADNRQATAGFTARFIVAADDGTSDWFQEFKVGLARSAKGGVWQIDRVETVEAVKWPGMP